MKYLLPYLFLLILISFGCEEPVLTPKPRAYPKVVLPEKVYQKFDKDFCAFTFDFPKYARVQQDEFFFEERAPHACWFDIYVPSLNSKIHCSYVQLDKKINTLDEMRNDAFKLVSKHNLKASYIDELPIERPDGTFGYAFDIEGPVASPFQFFLTDGNEHFLRGALYVESLAKPDSLAPIYEFMKTDIMTIVNTLQWE